MVRAVPVLVFCALALMLGLVLFKAPTGTAYPLMDKPLPSFALPALEGGAPVASESLAGQVAVINVFASWCVPCHAELASLKELSQEPGVTMVGVAWRDTAEKASQFLAGGGNPYRIVAHDADGRLSAPLGMTGVPETYVTDKQGVIRYRLAAPITREELHMRLLPLLRKLRDAP